MTTDREAQAREVLLGILREVAEPEDIHAAETGEWRSVQLTGAEAIRAMLAFATPPAGIDEAPEPAVPVGMKAYGPDHPDYPNAPGDWDGGKVRRRHGGMSMPIGHFAWSSAGGGLGNIIAYTPANTRGRWRSYDGSGELPKGCDPHSYVDICDANSTGIDIPAHQAFDREVTGWRPSIDDAFRAERETRAKAIYDAWKHQEGWEPWVERGNSLMQDKARGLASQEMSSAGGAGIDDDPPGDLKAVSKDGGVDLILPTVGMHDDQPFIDAWRLMEAKGFAYGEDALENVHLGWQLARSLSTPIQPTEARIRAEGER